jgi:hypothetical protein
VSRPALSRAKGVEVLRYTLPVDSTCSGDSAVLCACVQVFMCSCRNEKRRYCQTEPVEVMLEVLRPALSRAKGVEVLRPALSRAKGVEVLR